jgi:hypothetical protein
MKKFAALFVVLCTAVVTYSQEADSVLHRAAAVAGTYHASLPCEACRVIEAELQLTNTSDSSGEYILFDRYLGNGKNEVISSARQTGGWIVVKQRTTKSWEARLVLDYDLPEKASTFTLKANGDLLQLEQPGTGENDAEKKETVYKKQDL